MHSVRDNFTWHCWRSFGTRPGIHKSSTPFIWCKQCPLCPAPALTICLPHGRVVISHTVVTQLVLLLWLDNTEQLQESSHEDEDKENKAVFKSVTSVITLGGGWEGEGRQHSVRAATTQAWIQLYCKGALLIGKLISLFQGKPLSLGNSCKNTNKRFVWRSMYTRA